MADVASNTTSKKSPKKGESSKGSKKTWSPSEEEYLISRWAEADCLFNRCSAAYTGPSKRLQHLPQHPFNFVERFFWRRQRIPVPIPKHAAAI